MRVEKSVDSNVTKFLLDKNRDYAQVLEERNQADSLLVKYVFGDDLISQKRDSLTYFYHTDGQLSTRQLTDISQNITDTYTYDAFGLLLNQTGGTENNYLYTGEQYDPNVGFYYLRARYYNASIGRFQTMDTWPGSMFEPASLHKYLYCEGNPINGFDQSGHLSESTITSIVTAAFYFSLLGILLAITYARASYFINYLQTPVEWTGNWETVSIGVFAGIRIINASFKGIHKSDMGLLRGEGKYLVIMGGLMVSAIWVEPSKTITPTTLISPGPYSANPVVLAGTAGYISASQPTHSMPSIYGGSAYYIILGMGLPKSLLDNVGQYEGIDTGAEIMAGVSLKTYGDGPY